MAPLRKTKIRHTSLRDLIWNYPESFGKWYSKRKLFFFILLSIGLSVGLFWLLAFTETVQYLDTGIGNVYREATVGVITTINPLYLTQNPVDRDLDELIYDKLIYPKADGTFSPGLALKWEASENNQKYEFTLDDSRYWHDGTPIISEDVKYTIDKAKALSAKGDDTIGSVLENVEIGVIDDHHFTASIDEKNAVLLEALSIYILPKHVLSNVSDSNLYEYGLKVPPIGSGAYVVSKVSQTGLEFEKFVDYPTPAKITKLSYLVFPDIESLIVSLENNEIDAISHLEGRELGFINQYPNFSLDAVLLKQRKKLVFFNTRIKKLEDYQIRGGISSLIDKEALLDTSITDGAPVFNSISSDSWAFNKDADIYPFDKSTADILLKDAGYTFTDDEYIKKDESKIILTITYLENESNEALVTALKEQWGKYGIELKLRPKSYWSLTNEVMATQDFELLLFEVETSVDPDQYNLWHSSKVNYPDLNLSGYENGRVDLLLEEARVADTKSERKEKYQLIQKFMGFDAPVLFLYEPTFNLEVVNSIKGIELEDIVFPSDRFRSVYMWERK